MSITMYHPKATAPVEVQEHSVEQMKLHGWTTTKPRSKKEDKPDSSGTKE